MTPSRASARPKLGRIALLALVLAALAGFSGHGARPAADGSSGGEQGRAGRIVVLVVDKLAVEDLTEFAAATAPLREAAAQGAVGLMNVRTAAGADSAAGYLSLGAGGRSAGTPWSHQSLLVTERIWGRPAGDVYRSLTGLEPRGEAVHLGIAQLAAQSGTSGPQPGALGGALRAAGLKAAVIGSGDTASDRFRYAPLIAMGPEGSVDIARLGPELLAEDPLWPTGVRTDYDALYAALVQVLPEAALVVVDLADLARLEAVAPLLDARHGRALREAALERISRFAAAVVYDLAGAAAVPEAALSNSATAVYLVSPSPSRAFGRQGILVTPVVRWHPHEPAGLLTSGTTRRLGIVTNGDFTPSLLAELGVPLPPGAGGRPWRVVVHPQPFSTLVAQYHAIKEVHLQRLPVIQPYFFALLALTAAGALLVLALRHGLLTWPPLLDAGWRGLLGALALFPAALLLLSSFEPAPLAVTWLRALGLLAAGAAFAYGLGRASAWGPVGVAALLTAGLLVIDVLRGASLIQGSLLGYDPIAGSRYYGIGNEYMGTLIGSALMGVAYLKERLEKRVHRPQGTLPQALALGALTLLFAHPRLGINVGGAIAAGAATVGALLLDGRGFTWRRSLVGAALVGALLAGAAFADYRWGEEEASHLGRAVALVATSGSDPLWDLFARKLAVNVKLIRLTIWSRVTLASLALLSAVILLPTWISRALAARHPALVRMTRVALLSALVALVANDSGIVAAATLLMWPVLACLAAAVRLAAGSRNEFP